MEKLIRIQQELHAPKDLRNEFGGYNYRSAESILEAVKPMLDGALLLMSDEMVLIGNRFYVKSTVTFEDGDFVRSATAYAREEESLKGMTQGQITGATSSYARKYALNALFAIDNTSDLDTSENPHDEAKPTTRFFNTKPVATFEPLTDKQKWLLSQYDIEGVFDELGVKSWDEVSKSMAAAYISRLKEAKAKREAKYGVK